MHYPGICLKRLRNLVKIIMFAWSGLRFQPGTSRTQARSVAAHWRIHWAMSVNRLLTNPASHRISVILVKKHKRTTQAIAASHARKSRRLFVRPLRTQVVSIINVCARFLWPGVYLGRQDYTTYFRSFSLKCYTIDVSGDAATQAATLNTFVETPHISAVCCSLFRDSVSR